MRRPHRAHRVDVREICECADVQRRVLAERDRIAAPCPRAGRRIRLVTGASMAPFLRERGARLASAVQAEVEVVEVENRYFGPSVTIAGLLGGADVLDALGEGRAGDLVVLPAEALNAEGVMIDDVSLADLQEHLGPAEVRTGYELTAALGAA